MINLFWTHIRKSLVKLPSFSKGSTLKEDAIFFEKIQLRTLFFLKNINNCFAAKKGKTSLAMREETKSYIQEIQREVGKLPEIEVFNLRCSRGFP